MAFYSKAGLTLNDLYDTTCMTHNRPSNFYGVYTIIHCSYQVHKGCFSLQELKQNDLRTSCSMKSRKKRKKKNSLCEALG